MTLAAIQSFQLDSFLDSCLSVTVAFILGSIVGFERQYRQRTAGLRTNVLVAIGSSVFVDIAACIAGPDGAARAISYIISGVGFLGAGIIMRDQGRVSGLDTAATLWGVAAIGACAGADLLGESCLAALFVLLANTLLRPIANAINRAPLQMKALETAVAVHMIILGEKTGESLSMLKNLLRAEGYDATDIDVRPFADGKVEVEATFAAGSADTEYFERLVSKISAAPYVDNAYWSPVMLEGAQ